MLIDTHAHLHFSQFAGQVDGVLRRADEAGIGKIINVGVNTADSQKATELAATYEHVWAAVGIHPYDAGEIEQGSQYLRGLATRRKVVAIGECGIDLYKAEASLEQQEAALRVQIELAGDMSLPLIFHVREAFEPFWKVLADYPQTRGVVHSFTGNQADMERAVEAGLYVALNGIITYTKSDDHRAAAQAVPSNRLLLETDCPFLSPVPHRGKTNEPARMADTAAFLAELREESVGEIAAATTANAEALFGL